MSLLSFIYRKIHAITCIRLKYLFTGSIVIAKGPLTIGRNVRIRRSKLIVPNGSTLSVGDDCVFNRVFLRLEGDVIFGDGNIVEQQDRGVSLKIEGNGYLHVGDYNRIRSKIWIRFGGKLKIGSYTNINEGSEIRCDESVEIGDFTRVSYKVDIWDTNTHNIYNHEVKRTMIIDSRPFLLIENEKPITKPIYIGSDCWLGKDVAILKGTVLGDRCIVGYGVILTNVQIENNTTVISDIKLRQLKNNI